MLAATVFTAGGLVSRSGLHLLPLAVAVLGGLVYAGALGRLRAGGGSWPSGRVAAMVGAVVVVVVSTQSGLGGYQSSDFTVTAIGQIGLFVVAPVLVALSAPLTLALAATAVRHPARAEHLGRAVMGWPGRVAYQPVLTWVIYVAATAAAYLSGQYAWGVRHGWAAQLTDVELLVVGCLWLWPVVGADPRPRPLAAGWRILYLLLAFVYWSGLGLAVQSQQSRIAPNVTLSDLHTGAGILWTAGALSAIGLTIGVVVQWLAVDEGRARRVDGRNAAEDAHQLALWRADRRAAALADRRASEAVVVASRPAGTPDTDRSAGRARAWRDQTAAIEPTSGPDSPR